MLNSMFVLGGVGFFCELVMLSWGSYVLEIICGVFLLLVCGF